MLTLLGSLLGFLTSFVPSILKYLQDRQDKKHELKMLEMQTEANLKLGKLKLEALDVMADIDVKNMVYQFADPSNWKDKDIYKSFKSIIYLLTSSVRPVVTYLFLFGYLVIKLLIFKETKDYSIVWTEDDMAILAGVVSFWFGSREIGKRIGK